MPRINVTKPFRVQFARGKRPREYGVGVHVLTSEELGNWFVQAVIAEGRAEILPGVQVKELVPPGLPAAHDEFSAVMFGQAELTANAEIPVAAPTPEAKPMKTQPKAQTPALKPKAKPAGKVAPAKPKGKGK